MAKSKNKKISIPTMTIEEASEFWDEHSLFEFEGTEEVEVEFKLRKKQYIGISLKLFEQLETRAKKMNTSPEILLENWIIEKMNMETSQR